MRVFAGLLLLGFAAMPSAPARAGDDVPPSPAPPADKAAPGAAQAADDAAADEAPAKGSLVITVKAPDGLPIDGDVEIDHKPMGNLEDGELTLVNIPAGSHALVILAQGYQRFEHAVAVRGGEEAKLDARLIAIVPPSNTGWKWTLAGSAMLVGVGAIYGYRGHDRMLANRDAVIVVEAPHPNDDSFDFDLVEPADCGKSAATLAREKHAIVVNQDRFDRMCSWQTRSLIGYAVAGVGLAGVLVSVYMLTRHGEPGEYTPGPRKRSLFRPSGNPRSDGVDLWLTFSW